MKKLIAIVSVTAVIAGVGSALMYKEFNHSNSHSVALSRTFSSTEEIVKKANVIIKGKVPSEFRQEKVGTVVYNVYEVQVDKLYSNLSDAKITEGESIELYRLIGLDLGDNKELANVVDADYHELEKGEYLLFLSGEYDEELKKYTYIPNTPNQLFKMTSSKGLRSNQSDTEFENITKADELPSINEADLLEVIESMK
ncbi:hypothetical protein HP398_27160 [Brevibacillus sp. HB1.4B]|uniref:hypothetical protein n=1 Tax=unclassified Brevibacillus TaxID=2684853 RepID=UPI000852BAB0|nr:MULTISPECIES: hypothetical protein [unclassified Brevibacillus]MDC0762823.1 hypothetical protein [Brevibacillus sp. AG]NRS20109.1 hypothetical protein [Brevibacillus sp. HB1.4B]NTU32152.1 hypothetical protein [Brevibacillus sp. HB1.1]